MTESNHAEAAQHKFIHKRGVDLEIVWEFFDDDDFENPSDITNDEFFMDVRSKGTGKVLMSFSLVAGFAVTAPNILTATKTAAQTMITKGEHEYDLLRRTAAGKVLIRQEGPFIFYDKITEIPA